MPERVQPQPPEPGSAWRVRFWLIFGGQGLSLLGSAVTQFVLLWWITATTGDVASLSLAGIAALLPRAMFGPVGGVLADRLSRRWTMVVADALTAATIIVLVTLFATESVQLWHVYAIMALRSCFQAFQEPAANASTAMLVPTGFLLRAAGFAQTFVGLITIVAAPLGAFAMSVLPLAGALCIDVVTALFGIIPLLFFAIPQPHHEERRHAVSELREGMRAVWSNPGVLRLFGLQALMLFLTMPAWILALLLVREHFGGGAQQAALMEGIAGVGVLIGGVAIAALNPKRQVIVLGVSLGVSCLTMALAAAPPRSMFWLAIVWWAISGATYSAGLAPMASLLQRTIPNNLQGRVFSLFSTVAAFASPLGIFAAGPIGRLIGVRGLFLVGGTLGAVVCFAALLSPKLRALDRPAEPTPLG